eukprot:CAMPEP_0182444570 /NCGR_PEP_ID=MMETSP1172-20130603/2985_1 /TAXON_ID=708627 /ORGANISM="Timspurckia oligopyrenoides, Strain CCMP3278" /LENGTH=1058 /DNA_ID=CAMNT_0024640159 /DNA_START=44 /DNA_END=3217 /DNA_ORIENTATION=+
MDVGSSLGSSTSASAGGGGGFSFMQNPSASSNGILPSTPSGGISLQGSDMSASELARVESLAVQLYESVDQKIRSEAEAALVPLSQAPTNVPQCLWLLQNSQAPTVQLLAASSLTKIMSTFTSRLSVQERLEVRNLVLNFLAEKGPSLVPFVTTELCVLLCRTTKLSWNDDPQFRSILEGVAGFFDASETHCAIGLQLLIRLISEMNQSTGIGKKTFTQAQHRKVATSFRDQMLLSIFEVSLTTLAKLSPPPAHDRLRQNALELAVGCLNFDFIGTSFDETTDDMGAVQVPVSWRNIIEEQATPTLFFDVYCATSPHDVRQSSCALECLVQLSSVRRSLFSNDEKRTAFLNIHLRFMLEILRNRHGLGEHENYHHFCRWLARLKSNFQLAELVSSSHYPEWVSLVSQFTLSSLASDWHWVGNSLYYLLILWSRLVASMPYLKGNNLSHLDEHVRKIIESYITSRIHALHAAGDDADDPDEEFSEHFDLIPIMLRLEYSKSSNFLLSLLDPLLEQYKAYVVDRGISGESSPEVRAIERDLAWLIRIAGAGVGGRLSASSSESQEVADGDLSSRIFQLMIYAIDVDQKRIRTNGLVPLQACMSAVKLDEAIVDFAQSFRRAYIGEQAVATSKVYVRMGEQLGTSDNLVVLNIIASKIACNLRNYGVLSGDVVVSKSLDLLADLASGHSSGRILSKLATIREMLLNHDESSFPFMKGPDSKMGRNRTSFYQTLGRILFTGFGTGTFDTDQAFDVFMLPLQVKLDAISQVSNDQLVQDHSVKAAVIGVARDLRGICSATQIRKTYCMFFEWFYPKYSSVLCHTMETYSSAGISDVTIPLLKFYAEFVHNRPQRIVFDSSSPNGILLFRETSKILVAYGTSTLSTWQQNQSTVQNPYRALYKGAGVCASILSRALSGNYVNFGVFSLYGDSAFSDALEVSFRLALAIPVSELLAYQKLSKSYFGMLEILCSNHTANVVALEHPVFEHIVNTLMEGLMSSEVWMSTQCASALDHLAEYRFTNVKKDTAGGKTFQLHVDQSPDLFPRSLELLLNMVLNEECANQW